jgi:hypothetical protein
LRTGKSSKKITDTDNQIGEKGFGFKSVFSVADDVQVQSGLWSFRFKHQKGEDGLGIVTPLDTVPEALLAGVTMRITLRYADEAKQEFSRLLEAIQDLPDITILFLQRLRSIHIEVSKSVFQVEKISYTKQYRTTRTRCIITRSREVGFTKNEEKCAYLLLGRQGRTCLHMSDVPAVQRPGSSSPSLSTWIQNNPGSQTWANTSLRTCPYGDYLRSR